MKQTKHVSNRQFTHCCWQQIWFFQPMFERMYYFLTKLLLYILIFILLYYIDSWGENYLKLAKDNDTLSSNNFRVCWLLILLCRMQIHPEIQGLQFLMLVSFAHKHNTFSANIENVEILLTHSPVSCLFCDWDNSDLAFSCLHIRVKKHTSGSKNCYDSCPPIIFNVIFDFEWPCR